MLLESGNVSFVPNCDGSEMDWSIMARVRQSVVVLCSLPGWQLMPPALVCGKSLSKIQGKILALLIKVRLIHILMRGWFVFVLLRVTARMDCDINGGCLLQSKSDQARYCLSLSLVLLMGQWQCVKLRSSWEHYCGVGWVFQAIGDPIVQENVTLPKLGKQWAVRWLP